MSLTTVEVTTNEINSNKIGSLGLQQEEKEVSDWEKVAIQRRLEIEKAIPSTFIVPTNLLVRRNHVNLVQTCGLLTSREVSIVQMSAVTLLASIHTRAFTSVEVATAFCKSAAIAHQAVGRSQSYIYQYLGLANIPARPIVSPGSCSSNVLQMRLL